MDVPEKDIPQKKKKERMTTGKLERWMDGRRTDE
jgi:hypothetical protein